MVLHLAARGIPQQIMPLFVAYAAIPRCTINCSTHGCCAVVTSAAVVCCLCHTCAMCVRVIAWRRTGCMSRMRGQQRSWRRRRPQQRPKTGAAASSGRCNSHLPLQYSALWHLIQCVALLCAAPCMHLRPQRFAVRVTACMVCSDSHVGCRRVCCLQSGRAGDDWGPARS